MSNFNNSLPLLDAKLPSSSLDAYLHYVNQIPLLTPEEEQDLALRLQKNNDLAAAKRLIMAHLRYVARVAKGYLGYGLPLADLVQEGNIGLMKAVRRFNPAIGARLVTFAMHWIKAEIHEYILRNWRIVKVATTKAQRKLFFNLRNLKKRLGWMTHEEVSTIAKDLGVKPETVREMELRMASSDASFDGAQDQEDDEMHLAPVALLEDFRYSPTHAADQSATAQTNELVHQALENLDERSQDIIRSRWLHDSKSTLQDLASKYQVSAERIRQLEKNAFNKLKKTMQSLAVSA